jgi:uncharacterized protein
MKFLCDRMLGTLAKWLRIYGFDTFYANPETDDAELLRIAKEEKRTLVTRDIELTYNAKRENLNVAKIKTTDLDEQLRHILKYTKIDETKMLSRCILCNSEVNLIEKDKVKNKVPKKVFENNKEFWFCKKCYKVYWKGTHYEDMIKKTIELL